ncbi:28884_t:CDS:2, partial [Racocetra persica]
SDTLDQVLSKTNFCGLGKISKSDFNIRDGDCVVGLDPGRRDLFVAVTEKKCKINCSTKEWHLLAGHTHARKKREVWIKGNNSIETILHNIPTPSCSSITSYNNYLVYVLQHMRTLIEFYGARRWLRMRWKSYINRNKAYNKLCERITNKNPRTIVAYGDGKFSSCSKGHVSGPIKGLYKELRRRLGRRVRLVDEYRTMKSLLPRKHYTTYVPISNFQKSLLAVSSAFAAFLDPSRGDMIATLAETTSSMFLSKLRDEMLRDSKGRQILRERPIVNSKTIDLLYLRKLPEGTFGKEYTNFLNREMVTPDTREKVKYIEDEELAYVMQRYRECHDFFHTLTSLPVSVEGELALKWFEFAQTKLPMTLISSVVGPLRLSNSERTRLFEKYVPWAVQCGSQSKLLMNVYFEECWNKDIVEMRKELGIYL